MAKTSKNKRSKTKSQPAQPGYETLQAELDRLMAELQREDLDVDTALKHYRRGLELIEQLQAYLKTAENRLTELTSKPGPNRS
jgi:exodeoxyribonuclease VII small subunit